MEEQKKFLIKGKYQLEIGQEITDVTIGYHTYGKLNDAKDNVIWACHALTGNSDVMSWWSGLFGQNDLFNPKEHFIVCANILGSPYGSTNPLSKDVSTEKQFHHNFPDITVRDMVGLHKLLADHLGIEQIELLIGGSMGGQQALEWAILEPKRINNLALIASNAMHSPWGVAFNTAQRQAISTDPTWPQYNDEAGMAGMKVARSIALLSYRNYGTYDMTQKEWNQDFIFPCKAVGYQLYQGEKLAKRFNAFSYWVLSKAMDSMNVGRKRGGLKRALKLVEAKTLVVTMEDDQLFPKADQDFLVNNISDVQHVEIPTKYGHDGFLLETDRLSVALRKFLSRSEAKSEKVMEAGSVIKALLSVEIS